MGDEVILKDDGYDELEGVFNKDSEIPGDEVTGIIGASDSSSKTDDDVGTGDNGASDDDKGGTNDDKGDNDDNAGADDSKAAADADDKGAVDIDADDGDTAGKTGDDDADDNKDGESDDDLSAEASEPDLKAQLREQQRRVALTEAKLDTMARQNKADKAAEESDDEDAKPVAPSVIEASQIKLNELAETRGEIISDMLELMKVNPKYEDVEDVCSKTNLDDTIETLARAQVAKEGGDLVEIMMGLEVDIWSQRNPYSYMYGLIKDIHPTYQKAKDDKTGEIDGDTSKDTKKKKTPKKAPLSALDLARGGGGKDLGEWTAEKIDNLSETELNKVPDAVYKQYLRGDLDK